MNIGIRTDVLEESNQLSVNYLEGTDTRKLNSVLFFVLNEVLNEYPKYSKTIMDIIEHYELDKETIKREESPEYVLDFNVVVGSIISTLFVGKEYIPTNLKFSLEITEANQDKDFISISTHSRINISILDKYKQLTDDVIIDQLVKTIFNTYIANMISDIGTHYTNQGINEIEMLNVIDFMQKEYIKEFACLDFDEFSETLDFTYAMIVSTLNDFGLKLTEKDNELVKGSLNER